MVNKPNCAKIMYGNYDSKVMNEFGYLDLQDSIMDLLYAAYPEYDWANGCCIRPLEDDGFQLRDSETVKIIIR